MCPYCHSCKVRKRGFYVVSSPRTRKRRRYSCSNCAKNFSRRTLSPFKRQRTTHLNRILFRLLCAGVSQRECARILGCDPKKIPRKILALGRWADRQNRRAAKKLAGWPLELTFDEMESFEHTKCKPLSIAVAVDHQSRRILAAEVARMPAKGRLAAISRKKYGRRKDRRAQALVRMHARIGQRKVTTLRSDLSPRYPKFVSKFYPGVKHERYKGRRGCVVGQGELKATGHDEPFPLNHSCAMIRDHVKRLTRRTWCTTKQPSRLQKLLHMYTLYHNTVLLKSKSWKRTLIR